LLPGNKARLQNYTSYSRGINGIMVDIAGLPNGGLSEADFQFKVGNNNDPRTWSSAPSPASITVRPSPQGGGVDRVTLIWDDGVINGEWLRVIVAANADTGLPAADTFYFGNAIGDTFNSNWNAIVNAADVGRIMNQTGRSSLPITDLFDINRDGICDSQDIDITSSHLTDATTALQLITPLPEPTTVALVTAATVALIGWSWRKRRAK
jgi:hypothetical protein